VQSDGSQIGGTDPAQYGCYVVPGAEPALLLYTSGTTVKGGAWPAAEWYLPPQPVQLNTGHFSLEYQLLVGAAMQTAGNVFETDTILIYQGYKYNLSLQRHTTDGRIDIGNWTDTGLRLKALQPNTAYDVVIAYEFDTTKHTCSVLSYAVGDETSIIPARLRGMAATKTTWAEGALPQVQMGSLPAGDPWSVLLKNVKFRWW